MTLKNKAEMMRFAKRNSLRLGLALVLVLGLGTKESQADLAFQVKGEEYDLVPNLVGDQISSQSAISSGGGYLVWQDNATDEYGYGVSAVKMDTNSNPVGSPFKVNTQIIGDQEKPQVVVSEDGSALFAWEGGATGFRRVKYRFLNNSGQFEKEEQFATSHNSGEQTDPSLTRLINGNIVMSWTDFLEDGEMKGISAKILDKNGETLINSFRLNQFIKGNQYGSKLKALPNGGLVSVWISDQQQSNESIDVVARVYDSLGRPITNEIIINNKGICADPVVSVTNKTIMIAWEQLNLKNSETRWDIHYKKYDLNLKSASDQVIANTTHYGDQFNPKIEGTSNGAIIVWNSLGQDGSRETVMGRFLDQSGLFQGEEFQVNTKGISLQINPNITSIESNTWLVTWSTPKRGSVGLDIVGQRFELESNQEKQLNPISFVFVNPISDSEVLVSWPEVKGLNLDQYEIYMDNNPNPKLVNENYIIWKGLDAGREYAFRVTYRLPNGKKAPLSDFGFNRTWGKDFNKDGLPDDWQRSYFGKLVANWPLIDTDSDQDGVSNYDEFLTGTNPIDKDNNLKISVKSLERGQRISWSSVPGFVYQVEKTNKLNINGRTDWGSVGNPLIAVDNEVGLTLNEVENINFYRVKRIR